MNESVVTASLKNDGFGLVPINFVPGPLKRLLGYSSFAIEADRLVLYSPGQRREVFYSEIVDIHVAGRKIIVSDGSEVFKICPATDFNKVVSLIDHLRSESNAFATMIAATTTLEAGFRMFLQCLDFRALPYVRAVNLLLKIASDNCFTDIHFEPLDHKSVRITFRAAGEVKRALTFSQTHHGRLMARFKYLAGCLSHITDNAQEGAFRHTNFDVRVSTFPTDNGERASIRIITALRYPDTASLGWDAKTASLWINQINQSRGLYIISGPVGSGKTTAMYATLAQLAGNDGKLRVVTIEDPVEASIGCICQSSLDLMKEKSLAVAFKHLLRQDPDVIALGEIRDSLCVREALQAALSGHLIIATFHAGSAVETIDRITQMGIDDKLVMSGLQGVLHLNLLRSDDGLRPVVNFNLFDGKSLRSAE